MNKVIYFTSKQISKNDYAAKSSLDDISKIFTLSGGKVIFDKEKLTLRKILSTNNNFIVLSIIDAIFCFIYSIVVFRKPKIILTLRGAIPVRTAYNNHSYFLNKFEELINNYPYGTYGDVRGR